MQRRLLQYVLISLLALINYSAYSQTLMPIPPHGSTFTGNTRGYWFTAPTNFTITGLRVPTEASANAQNIQVVRLAAVPPVFSAVTNNFTTLALFQNVAGTAIIPVNITVNAGDIIGILGTRGTSNSYASGPYSTTIDGNTVSLGRLGFQANLNTIAAFDIWQELTGNISRTEMYYTTSLLPLTSSNDASMCLGDSALLSVTVLDSASFISPYTYAWSPSLGLNCDTCQSTYANPSVTTTYTIVVTDFTGLQDTTTSTVTVSGSTPTANAGSDLSFCAGDSIALNGSGGPSYMWSPSTGLSDSTIANPVASPLATTSYVLTVDNGCGTDTDTVLVSVLPLPIVSSTDTAVCPGDTVQLLASGGVSYNWSPGGSLDDSTIANPLASPNVTTVYSIAVTAASGCVNMDTLTVTVDSINQLLASTDKDTICPLDSAQLNVTGCSPVTDDFDPGIDPTTWNAIIGGTASTVCLSVTGNALFFDAATTRSAETIDLNVSGGGTVNFWLHIADVTLGGCENADPNEEVILEYSVNGGASWINMNTYLTTAFPAFAPVSETIPGAAQTAATRFRWSQPNFSGAGFDNWAIDDVDISCGGVDTSLTFSWSPTTGLSNPNIFNPMASPNITTTYVVSASIGSCTSTDTVTIFVDTANAIAVSATSTDVCQGDSVILSITGTPGLPDTSSWTYLWSPAPGLSNTASATPSAFPLSTTTYQVDVTNACGTFTDSITLISKTAPTANAGPDQAFCFGGSVQITGSGGVSYLWGPNQFLDCTTCDKTNANPPSDMTYYVTAIDSFGCTDVDTVLIEVNGIAITASATPSTLCFAGDTVQLNVSGQTDIEDNFDPAIDPNVWTGIVGGFASTICLSVSGDALYFDGNVTRTAETVDLNVSGGGTVDFWLHIADATVGSCENADPGEEVVLEYSIDAGATWVNINTYLTTAYPVFALVSETIPAGAQTGATRFRWNQPAFSGSCCDHWAIDDMAINTVGDTLDSTAIVSWSPGGTLDDSTTINPIALPGGQITYVVTVDDVGCLTSDSITIFIDSTVITATNDTSLCLGDTVQIGVVSNTPVASYLWSPATGLSSTTIQSPTANPSIATTYSVEITNTAGCTFIDSVVVSIDTAPIAAFSVLTTDLEATFTNTSISGTSYLWDFGDGFLATTANPVHTFSSDGTYNVCLTVTNSCGTDSMCSNVTVTLGGCNNTVAAFDTISVDLTTVFTDLSTDATSWSWDFGDGGNSSVQNPVYTYAAAGTYNVCLITTNPCSSDSICMMVTVTDAGTPPCTSTVAGFTSSSVGLDAVFVDGSSDATSWSWDFGDGNTSIGQNPVHTYAADGTYNVCLIASNACSSDTTCMNVIVSAATCNAAVAGFTSAPSGLTVNFTDTSTDPTGWAWDFGDGNTSSVQNPVNIYATAGTYTVCLTVTNPCSTDSLCSTVTVVVCSTPAASFTSTANDLTVTFADASTGATSWSWDFGDGNTSNAENPLYSYSAAGTYYVCLTANSGCATDVFCDSVTVTSCPAIVAAFTFSDSLLSVSFDDFSIGAGNWSWDFGDGFNSSVQNATHLYALPGTYTVCLTASSACASDNTCQDVTLQTVGIEENKLGNVSMFPNPTTGLLTVNLSVEATPGLTFIVYNMLGEIVYNKSAKDIEQSSVNGKQSSFTLDLQNLSDGAYLMQMLTNDKMHMEEIIISR